jgi:hypothetical protein
MIRSSNVKQRKSGSWTHNCWDRFDWWPLRLGRKGEGSIWLKASMTGEGGAVPLLNYNLAFTLQLRKSMETSVRVPYSSPQSRDYIFTYIHVHAQDACAMWCRRIILRQALPQVQPSHLHLSRFSLEHRLRCQPLGGRATVCCTCVVIKCMLQKPGFGRRKEMFTTLPRVKKGTALLLKPHLGWRI